MVNHRIYTALVDRQQSNYLKALLHDFLVPYVGLEDIVDALHQTFGDLWCRFTGVYQLPEAPQAAIHNIRVHQETLQGAQAQIQASLLLNRCK